MPTRLALLLITLLWSVIYLPGLGTRELQGEEARRVLPGRTMLQSGEWIVTKSGGKVYNRKPPLVNWMSAAAISISGRMDEWTVRLPSTLMLLALALCAYVCLRGWLGGDKAMLVALMTLTTIGFIEKGRLIEIEALYMALSGIAMVSWLGLRWQGREVAAWVVSGLLLGLGFLAKGPVHVLYFYAIAGCVLAAEQRLRDLLRWPHWLGLGCFFIVWVPWAVMNASRNPLRDSGAVWIDQVTHRLGFVEFDFLNYLLQIPQSLVNLLPWALFLPLCWRNGFPGAAASPSGATASKKDRHAQWMLGLRRGLLLAFLPIALLPSSRPRFMLPLNVPAAILITEALSLMGAEWLGRVGKRWRVGCAVVASVAEMGVIGVGVFQSIATISPQTAALPWPPFYAWVIAFAGLVLIAWHLHRQPSTQAALADLGIQASLALGSLSLFGTLVVFPLSCAHDDLRPFAASITQHIGEDARIMLYKIDERMWPFYLGLRCHEVADIKQRPEGIQWMLTGSDTWQAQQAMLEQRLGKASPAVVLKDPRTKEAYVLVQFQH
jgi:4-amino-4-deoxy-L-arabinose transferase-like glycosyltransferase